MTVTSSEALVDELKVVFCFSVRCFPPKLSTMAWRLLGGQLHANRLDFDDDVSELIPTSIFSWVPFYFFIVLYVWYFLTPLLRNCDITSYQSDDVIGDLSFIEIMIFVYFGFLHE